MFLGKIGDIMGCVLQLLFFPLIMAWYFIKFMFYIFIAIIQCILGLLGVSTSKKSTSHRTTTKYKKRNNKSKCINLEFDKEANLWGLSEEDRKRAKDERMSPADYIEAEERDNDELIDDD
jgi:cytochrome c biogenesis protein ResB